MKANPSCAAVFDRIDALNDEYIRIWADICRIESPTEYKAGVDAVGRYLIDKAEARGWTVEVQPQPVSGDCVCITMNPDAPGAPICFSGHMDTVHPVGSFGEEPVTFDETYIYGPGVGDCKGGIAASFLAMAALEDCGFAARPVKLILQSDEENSSRWSNKTTVEFMCEKAKGSALVFNTEPCGDYRKTTIGRKGIMRFRLTVTGKAEHGSQPQKGINAICEAAHKIIALEKWKEPHGITMNCGLINGGTAENTVPASCTFTVDVRFKTPEQMAEAESYVRDTAAHCYLAGTTCEVELASSRSPMEITDFNKEALARVSAIYEANGFDPIEGGFANGGSDAAYFTAAGMPCIDSVGVVCQNIHSINENAELASLALCAKHLAAAAWCY